ncbi:MAG: S41 family peptidase [Planctomycetota bacterium]
MTTAVLRGTSQRIHAFSRGLGLCLSALALVAVVTGPARADDTQAWRDATTAREGELANLLSSFATDQGVPNPEALQTVAGPLGQSLRDREAARDEQIAEAEEELEEHLDAAADRGKPRAERDIELAHGLRLLVRLQTLDRDPEAFTRRPDVGDVVRQAELAARDAEDRGDWLIANELFYRLSVLLDDDRAYESDVDRLNERLAMIRLYAPERFWQLRNERRLIEGEDELPPYNATGDSFEGKVRPITRRMVERAVQLAAFRHVEGRSLRDMLIGGLESVETFVTTEDLADAFSGLKDEEARETFLRALRARKDKIASNPREPETRELDATISDLLDTNRYTIRVMPQALLHEFGNGTMSALDQFSGIIWPDEVKRFERSTRGEFIGVGIQIQLDELQNIRVVTPLEGTPAQRIGVRSGDVIKKVNGDSTVGFTLDQAVEVITGKADTDVTLTLERGEDDEKQTLDFTITRKKIDLPTVKGWEKTGPADEDWNWFVDQEAGIGYLRITNFAENTTRSFDDAVEAMRAQGLNGLVLDLRFNPGGLLDQAVSISNRFVQNGLIVQTQDARGRVQSREWARRMPKSRRLDDIPVVVLINEGSASASEIVSGAIQSHAQNGEIQAVVIGQRSYGKGSVQNVSSLSPTGSAAMRLTTQYYSVGNGRVIHRKPGSEQWGVDPDITVEMLPDQIVEAATVRRNADVRELDENGELVKRDDAQNPNDLITEGIDLQLGAALMVLKGQRLGGHIAALDTDKP